MSKHSISIDDKLYEEISEYCKLNSLKINAFCNKLLKNGLNTEKYGDIPFGMIPHIKEGPFIVDEIIPIDEPFGQPEKERLIKHIDVVESVTPVETESPKEEKIEENKDKKQITVKRRKL